MTTMTRQDWEQRYQSLRIEGRAFIDGSYRDAVGGATFDSISPVAVSYTHLRAHET